MKNKSKLFWIIVTIVSSILLFYKSSSNNVCKNYSDYFLMHNNENCWHEPGYYAEVPQIILQRNYSLETYYTVTEDGYILKTFRILPKGETKGLIFLEHSFVANAEIWVDKGDLSLGLYLLDKGYEVWLGNLRGSKYSNTHLNYTMSDFEYWDFSFHEQGYYDMKSQFDLVQRITNRNDIVFISYSMAGTSSIAYASLRPNHAKNSLKAIINIGSLIHISNMQGAARDVANILENTKILKIMQWLRIGWLPYGSVLSFFKNIACNSHPFRSLCIIAHEPMIGFSKTEMDASNVPIILQKFPDGASVKSLNHYLQMYYSGGKMQLYDYGPEENMRLYNSTKPPLYPLRNINVPVFTYHGTEDFFTNSKDIEDFYNDLRQKLKYMATRRWKTIITSI
ncbi:hypothetical protein HHI36_011833 [Cryptolaemus montrouzieri]|uniref:Lipase n=1 Tax=Cryptolaemus montrouzieri TaxID=559131 RepID=A0ABD2NCV2_9CUCU